MRKFTFLMAMSLAFSLTALAQSKTAAVSFDGVENHVVVPYDDALKLGRSPFTIECWFRADPVEIANKQAPILISSRDSLATSTQGWLFGLNDKGYLAIQLKNTSISGGGFGMGPGKKASDLRDGQCHHIAWVRETGGVQDTMMGYEDLQYVRNTRKPAGQADLKQEFDVWMGWTWYLATANYYQWAGEIKEIRIWNYARTQNEIQADYQKHLTGNENGLIAYWRFNENAGTTVYECVNDNHGTMIGATWANNFCDNMSNAAPANCGGGGTVGIDQIDASTQITFYPNPVVNELRVNSDAEFSRVSIYDMNGRIVLQSMWNGSSPLKIDKINAGTYLVQLTNQGQPVHKSMITKE